MKRGMDIKRIEFASQDKINELCPYVQRVLEALGHPEAWVSDESTVGDFLEWERTGEFDEDGIELTKPANEEEVLAKLRARLGLDDLEADDYIWEIARRLKEKAGV